MDITLLCRSCMNEMSSWERENFDQSSAHMFSFCTSIEVTDDGLPNCFCQDCIVKIKSSYAYIKKAQEVNITLKNIVSRKYNSVIVKTEQCTEVDEKAMIDLNFDSKVKYEFTTDIPLFDNTDPNSDSDCALSDIKIVKDANALTNVGPNVIEQHQIKTESVELEKRDYDHNECENEKTNKSNNTCRICLKDFKLERILKRHISMAHPKKNIKVKGMINEKPKNARIKNDAHETKSEMCPICYKIFIHKKTLQKHMNNTHTKKKVKEKGIKKDENEHQITNVHEYETKHNDGKEITSCSMCDRTFTSKVWFQRHIEREHSKNGNVLACSCCTKSFRTDHQLRYHLYTAHPEQWPHVCGACGKRFRKRKQLAAHAVVHGAARPHSCVKCDMVFKSSSVLANHMKVHKGERPHLCHVCGASFLLPDGLRIHMLTHTGAKPFACDQCSYRGATLQVMRRHTRTHNKARDRPEVCRQCGKAFDDRNGLNRHTRYHTGDQPYKCPLCELSFMDSWKRRMHMQRAHGLALEDIPKLRRNGQVDTGGAAKGTT